MIDDRWFLIWITKSARLLAQAISRRYTLRLPKVTADGRVGGTPKYSHFSYGDEPKSTGAPVESSSEDRLSSWKRNEDNKTLTASTVGLRRRQHGGSIRKGPSTKVEGGRKRGER